MFVVVLTRTALDALNTIILVSSRITLHAAVTTLLAISLPVEPRICTSCVDIFHLEHAKQITRTRA